MPLDLCMINWYTSKKAGSHAVLLNSRFVNVNLESNIQYMPNDVNMPFPRGNRGFSIKMAQTMMVAKIVFELMSFHMTAGAVDVYFDFVTGDVFCRDVFVTRVPSTFALCNTIAEHTGRFDWGHCIFASLFVCVRDSLRELDMEIA